MAIGIGRSRKGICAAKIFARRLCSVATRSVPTTMTAIMAKFCTTTSIRRSTPSWRKARSS
jgi:hypothetical protein